MILLRTTTIDDGIVAFGEMLEAASDSPVVALVDERAATASGEGLPKLSLNAAAYAELGLFTPHDVGWRCGDYGFYAARRRFPEVERFWMIEFDVRILGRAAEFFERCAARGDLDLLAARLRPADQGWWWHGHVASANARPYRCFFPVVRLSAGAIDLLMARRMAHSRQLSRRLLWPNDEAFVATTVVESGLTWSDLNDLGDFYDDETFSYEAVLDEASLPPSIGAPKLYHPVLSGERYARKVAQLARERRRESVGFRLQRAITRRINAKRRW